MEVHRAQAPVAAKDALSDGLHLAAKRDVAQLVEHQLPKHVSHMIAARERYQLRLRSRGRRPQVPVSSRLPAHGETRFSFHTSELDAYVRGSASGLPSAGIGPIVGPDNANGGAALAKPSARTPAIPRPKDCLTKRGRSPELSAVAQLRRRGGRCSSMSACPSSH